MTKKTWTCVFSVSPSWCAQSIYPFVEELAKSEPKVDREKTFREIWNG